MPITNQPYYYEEEGVPYNVIYPRTYGIDFYGDSLFTSEQELENHPDRVKAFRKASLKGWTYAFEHTEEIIKLISDKYNSKKNPDHLSFEAGMMRKLVMPDLIEMGHMNPGRWVHIAETFKRFQFIDSEYSMDGFIYNPNPMPDVNKLYWIIGIIISIAILIGLIVVVLLRLNNRLQKEITERKKIEKVHQSVIELHHFKDDSQLDEILKQGLEIGIQLTNSEIGYLHFLNPD